MNTSGRVGEGDAQVRLRLTTMVVEGPAAKTKRARRGMMMATVGGGPRTRRSRRGRVQLGAEEEEARLRVEERGALRRTAGWSSARLGQTDDGRRGQRRR